MDSREFSHHLQVSTQFVQRAVPADERKEESLGSARAAEAVKA